MTWAGAFVFFRNTTDFTLRKLSSAGFDQNTGVRVAQTSQESTIKGALDPLTEEDLQLVRSGQIPEGSANFFTEESYGVTNADVIIDGDGVEWRIVQKRDAPHIINDRFPSMDVVGFFVARTVERG